MDTRIVFFGTPGFAEDILKGLIAANENVTLVVCQPDKPKGRGYQVAMPEAKCCALERSIPVFQPDKLKTDEAYGIIKAEKPDMIIVAAYGKILPKRILDLPPLGCINVHGSLLPKYRGAAPVQRCIINGEKKTGVTIMRMDEGCDTGDMIAKAEIDISDDTDCGGLFKKMGEVGSDLLIKTLPAIKNGTAVYEKQDESRATYSPKIEKSELALDFTKSAKQLHDLIRGVYPYLVCSCYQTGGKGRRGLKIAKTEVAEYGGVEKPGEVIEADPKKGVIAVACGKDALLIRELIPEGKKLMSAADYVRGRQIASGDILSGE